MMWHVASPTSKYFGVISKNVHANKQKIDVVNFFCAPFSYSSITHGSLEVTNLIPSTTIVGPCSDEVVSINITLILLFFFIIHNMYIFYSLFSC